MNAFKTINSAEFVNQILEKKANAIVKFSNAWNSSAQLMNKTLEGLAEQYEGKVNFYQVDSDQESSLVSVYGVESVPTLLFFKEGTLVDKLTGLAQRGIVSTKAHQLIY